MNPERAEIEAQIKLKLVEIAKALGMDASELTPSDIIPASGLIDSAGLLELIVWFEQQYAISLGEDEVTIDNLGSISLMADFALKKMTQPS